MKTIAELKAKDIHNITKSAFYSLVEDFKREAFEKGIKYERQSLSQSIAESVAGCEHAVGKIIMCNPIGAYEELVYCNSVPPEQKCQGCQRLLKFKRWLE